ncbi:hypothetical protein O181_102336 [Austropuccinia psidii MF-1]|uniref:Uncharacterized protein n=1 Tax=Austropuccinia psidii MF-1 TaxID=1389203 RepID=A0A9Q3JIL4_9BASI|nr:hypothetical protein [Austropuccinia psidii MF-1]
MTSSSLVVQRFSAFEGYSASSIIRSFHHDFYCAQPQYDHRTNRHRLSKRTSKAHDLIFKIRRPATISRSTTWPKKTPKIGSRRRDALDIVLIPAR